MSTDIEFRHTAVRIDLTAGTQAIKELLQQSGSTAEHYGSFSKYGHMVFVEVGCSNTFDQDNKIARRWYLAFFSNDVLSKVIPCAVGAESEMIRLRGRSVKAETYIRHYRNLLANAVPADIACGFTAPSMAFDLKPELHQPPLGERWEKEQLEKHPFTAFLRDRGLLKVVPEGQEFGRPVPAHERLTVSGFAPDPNNTHIEKYRLWLAAMTWLTDLGHGGALHDSSFKLQGPVSRSWMDELLGGDK